MTIVWMIISAILLGEIFTLVALLCWCYKNHKKTAKLITETDKLIAENEKFIAEYEKFIAEYVRGK